MRLKDARKKLEGDLTRARNEAEKALRAVETAQTAHAVTRAKVEALQDMLSQLAPAARLRTARPKPLKGDA